MSDTRYARLALYSTICAGIRTCTSCGLHACRKQAVPGVGSLAAKIVVVGEAPGENEDDVGEPFVGRSGGLLNTWLEDAGLKRSDVYILNTVQCRPPSNRDPHPSEAAACARWLEAQLLLIQPAVILAVGRHAANALTSNRAFNRTMAKLRGGNPWPCSVAGAESAKVFCLYHPSYVLRVGLGPTNDQAKSDVRTAVTYATQP